MKIIPEKTIERALTRVVMGLNGCHISTMGVDKQGYPLITGQVDGKSTLFRATRAAWTGTHGPIPDGLTIDHLCRTPRCVRVDHMRLLTRSENARRNWGRDYPLGQSCERGHDPSQRVPANRSAKAGLVCRECKREKWHEWKHANPEKHREYVQRAHRVRQQRKIEKRGTAP